MSVGVQTLAINAASKRNLVHRLRSKGPVLRFEAEPVLAALCTSLALEFEIGNPDFDRFSPFLGVSPAEALEKDLVVRGSEVGLRLRRREGKPFSPRHSDLAHLLDCDSLDTDGQLKQALIFPGQVARTYRERGFELVIVRDWLLSSALCLEDSQRVKYLHANEWEIRAHIAGTQARMMARNQIAFFGAHDIVDHLFGSDRQGFESGGALCNRVLEAFERLPEGARESRPHLLSSYLIGIALDDLAQPRWYGSKAHAAVVEFCVQFLLAARPMAGCLELPDSFHSAVSAMRASTDDHLPLQNALERFAADLIPSIAC